MKVRRWLVALAVVAVLAVAGWQVFERYWYYIPGIVASLPLGILLALGLLAGDPQLDHVTHRISSGRLTESMQPYLSCLVSS